MKMYNEEQKQRFLNEIDIKKYPDNYWPLTFDRYEPIESSKGKDLYNFTKSDIFEAHKYQNYKSFETLLVHHINLKNYVYWAMRHNLVDDGMNHFADFTHQEIYQCVNQLQIKMSILTREVVEKSVGNIKNPRDRFMVMCVYEGIRGKKFSDMLSLHIEDFDVENKTVKLPNGIVRSVSPVLIDLAFKANEQSVYIGNPNLHDLYGKVIVKSTETPTEFKTPEQLYTNCIRAFRRAFDEMGFDGVISTNSLYTSGMIDKINQMADEHKVTARDVLFEPDLWKELLKYYSIPRSTKTRFMMKYGDFLKQ